MSQNPPLKRFKYKAILLIAMIRLIGKIKQIGTVKILNVYSKNLAKEILKRKNKISIKSYEDGIIIGPNGKFHATIAQDKRIQISITKIIKKKIIESKKINNKEIYIYINPLEWNLKEIISKSIHIAPISNHIPKNLMIKRAAIKPNKNKYYLDLSIKRLYELAKEDTIKCLFNRDNEGIIIIRSTKPEARRLTPHSKKRVQISIPKEIIKEMELKEIDANWWFPINIKMNLKSFGLNITDFYSIKEEMELVASLLENGIKIKVKDYRNPYDIFIPQHNSGIEIHNSTPGPADLSTRHNVRPGQVRLRILEAENLIRNKKVDNFFVILNKSWENGKYIKELTENVYEKVNVFFTDFKKDWNKEISKKIIKNLNQ